MYGIECVRCKRIFECEGKLNQNPCVCFEDRRNEHKLQKSNGDRKEEQRTIAQD